MKGDLRLPLYLLLPLFASLSSDDNVGRLIGWKRCFGGDDVWAISVKLVNWGKTMYKVIKGKYFFPFIVFPFYCF